MEKADLLWRSALWFSLLCLVAISAVGYFTYQWAIGVDTARLPTKTDRSAFSLAELEAVIAVYQKKQTNFEQLLHASPKTPSYQKDAGVPVPASALQEQPEAPVTPEPAASPAGPQG